MKYEIRGRPGNYSVHYGPGYPYGESLRYACFTLWGAKRVIRRHKRRVQRGKIAPKNRYEIIWTEEALTRPDVEKRIAELERELGMNK